jgi:hypothetical protein
VPDLARPDHAGPEHTEVPASGTGGAATVAPTATAYDPASGPPMIEALRAARSFEDLLERLRAAGLSR